MKRGSLIGATVAWVSLLGMPRPGGASEVPPSQVDPRVEAFEHAVAAGEAARKASDWVGAETAYRQAFDQASGWVLEDPRRLEVLEALGELYEWRLNRSLAAGPYWEQAWEIRLRAGTATAHAAWKTRSGVAGFYEATRAWGRLEALQRRWLDLVQSIGDPRPEDVVTSLRDLAGTIARSRPDDPEAVDLLERAFDLASGDETRRRLGRTLARRYAEDGRLDEASGLLQELARQAEIEPLFDSQEVSSLYEEVGEIAVSLERPELAESAFREALAAKSRHLGDSHPHLAGYRRQLAAVLASQERWAEARAELEAALSSNERTWGRSSRLAAAVRDELAVLERRARGETTDSLRSCSCSCDTLPNELEALLRDGRVEEAIALSETLLAAAEQEDGPVSRAVADILDHRITLFWSLDGPAAAAAAARRFEVLLSLGKLGDPEVSDAAGRARYLASTLSRTEDVLRFAAAEVESRLAARELTGQLAEALEELGRAYQGSAAHPESIDSYALAVEVYAETFGEGTPEHREARRQLADALSRAGRHPTAEELVLDLIAELEPLAARDRWDSIELDYALGTLVRILRATDRPAEARAADARRQALAHYQSR